MKHLHTCSLLRLFHSWAFIASPYRSWIGSPSEIGLPNEDGINYDDRLGGWWVNPNYNFKRKP